MSRFTGVRSHMIGSDTSGAQSHEANLSLAGKLSVEGARHCKDGFIGDERNEGSMSARIGESRKF
jgi:hypothetical protein